MGEEEGWRSRSVRSSGDGAEGRWRLRQVVCYRLGMRLEGLDLEKRREKRRSAVSLSVSLATAAAVFSGNPCWCWRLG